MTSPAQAEAKSPDLVPRFTVGMLNDIVAGIKAGDLSKLSTYREALIAVNFCTAETWPRHLKGIVDEVLRTYADKKTDIRALRYSVEYWALSDDKRKEVLNLIETMRGNEARGTNLRDHANTRQLRGLLKNAKISVTDVFAECFRSAPKE
jgi:hypothetical protein